MRFRIARSRFYFARFYSKRQNSFRFVVYCAGFWPLKAAYFLTKSGRIRRRHYSKRNYLFRLLYIQFSTVSICWIAFTAEQSLDRLISYGGAGLVWHEGFVREYK